ncbi:MAG: hypothetical protein ACXABO_14080 [Promethearchaeota archaeon]
MKLNQKFFGQEHFEKETPKREFCESLIKLKPRMFQYGFSEKDIIPKLPNNKSGVVQVKYNGMLSIIIWNENKQRFVAWSPRGRCYFSRGRNKEHPVTKYFNDNLQDYKEIAFVGETHVVRMIQNKAYMSEFNKSMSIIKNPKSLHDVKRIRLALFDYALVDKSGNLIRPGSPLDRFNTLCCDYKFPNSCDSGIVHLSDHMIFTDEVGKHQNEIQSFWNEYIGKRGFEGLVLCLDDGITYKLKYRDTLDVVIIAFRIPQRNKKIRPVCDKCGLKFDSIWLKKLAREGIINKDDWFKDNIKLKNGTGTWEMYLKDIESCPLCEGSISYTDGPILGAKIALMTENGSFVDIADGSQIPPTSPILDLIEPLYEDKGYLWVKPQIVIEVSYQDLYVDRLRPLLKFEEAIYKRIGDIECVSLRPYGTKHRIDKTVNPVDLRLEQISYFVKKRKNIQQNWEKEVGIRDSNLDKWL